MSQYCCSFYSNEDEPDLIIEAVKKVSSSESGDYEASRSVSIDTMTDEKKVCLSVS